MNTETINTQLYEKMFAEQERYRDWLLHQPPEEILNHAYEYAIREDILMALESRDLSFMQAQMLKMKEINLREYYPFYNMDVYLEVSDEIAGQLDRFKLDEEAHRVRVLRAKAYFSLNRGDGIEKDALQKPPQPLELILKAEQAERLNAALRSLSERQRRRLLAFYLDGKSKSQIAREEGVSENSVRDSIQGGLMRLKKSLKNF